MIAVSSDRPLCCLLVVSNLEVHIASLSTGYYQVTSVVLVRHIQINLSGDAFPSVALYITYPIHWNTVKLLSLKSLFFHFVKPSYLHSQQHDQFKQYFLQHYRSASKFYAGLVVDTKLIYTTVHREITRFIITCTR